MWKKVFQYFLRRFQMTQGRSPMTPAEYNLIEREAVNWINKTGGKTLPGTPQSQKPPFQGFTPRVIEGGKGKEGIGTLLKDSPEAIAKIKAENKAAAERIRQRRYEEAVKAEQDKMAADEDYIPDIIDPEDFASGGIAGELHLNRPGYKFGGKALKAIMDAWRANKTWGVGGPPFRPEKTSFNIREMTKRNLGQEFSLKELKEISESPFGEFASRGTGRAPPTFKEFNTEFKNIKARILKEKLEESKLHAEAMISSAKQIPAEDATAKKIHAQFIREGKKQLEEANEGLKAIDIYMGMLQKKGRSVHAEGGIAGELHLNDGGRAGFKKGKKVDLSKRRFLKGTGAALGVLSMLPFVGKFFKSAAKVVGKFKGTPNLVVDITKTPNMPEWYIPLIKKVLNKGDEITDTAATTERQIVHRDILPDGDEVIVTQNIDNQTIGVHVVNPKDGYRSASGAGEQPYQIQYSKGKVIEEGKYKGQKEADTLEVDEPYVAHRGPDDSEIEFDISTYNPKAEVHDTSVLESYATGKKVKSRGSGEVPDPYEGYSPDLKADKAEGGLAHVLGV